MKHVETGTRVAIRILVTGFGAFPGAPRNPSASLLDKLGRHGGRLARLGLDLETGLLPVVFDQVGPATEVMASNLKPDVILHLGLASRRHAISIETRAVNRAGPIHPDAARRRTEQILMPDGAAVLKATYPTTRVAAAIRGAGIPASCSIDAGDYICNATLYRTLAAGLAPMAGFIHVPRPRAPNRRSGGLGHRRPTLDDLTTAVLAAILVLGREARRDKALGCWTPKPRRRGFATGHR